MAQSFGNPYQPATDIGAGLHNIAVGLFGGRRGSTRDPALDAAHMGLYDEQAKAKAVERQLNERLLADQSGDAQDELIAARVGLPVHSVKGYRRALQTGGNLEEYAPYSSQLSDAMLAIRPAYADKSISPVNIADALNKLKMGRDRDAVLAGTGDAGRTANAYYSVSGKPRYDNMGDVGTFDLTTGVQTLNPLGTAKVGTETAHQGAYKGQERASNAAAGASSALARQRDIENKAGVKIGAPVVVNDPERGVIYTSPVTAVGGDRTAAARPTAAPMRPVLNEDGTTTYEPLVAGAHQQVGAPPRAAVVRAPRKVTPNDRKMLESSVGEVLTAMEIDGTELDPATKAAILKQAEAEFAGGSPGHMNAVQDAINKVAPEGFEPTGIYGFRKQTAKGGPRAVERPAPGTTPGSGTIQRTAAPAAAPAPAAAAPKAAPGARPAGMSDAQLIDDANHAIEKLNADPAKVKARLKAWGVKLQD